MVGFDSDSQKEQGRYDALVGKHVVVYTSGPTSVGRLEEIADFDHVILRPSLRPTKRLNGKTVSCIDSKNPTIIPYHAIVTMDPTTRRYMEECMKESRNPPNGEKKDAWSYMWKLRSKI